MTAFAQKYHLPRLCGASGLLLAILIATHLPEERMPDSLTYNIWGSIGVDKLVHIIAYGAVMALFLLAIKTPLRLRTRLALFLLITVIAALDEVTQPWFGRAGHLFDWLADVIGLILVLVCYRRRGGSLPDRAASLDAVPNDPEV